MEISGGDGDRVTECSLLRKVTLADDWSSVLLRRWLDGKHETCKHNQLLFTLNPAILYSRRRANIRTVAMVRVVHSILCECRADSVSPI